MSETTANVQEVKKEVKLVFMPQSPRRIDWESGMTCRTAMERAGFTIQKDTEETKYTYTFRVNGAETIGLDDLVPEPNGSTVTYLAVTEDTKGGLQ